VRITGTGNDLPFIRSLYNAISVRAKTEFSFEVNPKYNGSPVSIEVAAKPPLGLDSLGQMVPVTDAAQLSTVPPRNTPDRHLDAEQQLTIARTLGSFKGQRITLIMYPGDPEISSIAGDIDKVLSASGWIGSLGRSPALRPVRGVLVEIDKLATSRDRNAAEWLAKALGEALNVSGPRDPDPNKSHAAPITITIGRKP
jgi:hypothetical protein